MNIQMDDKMAEKYNNNSQKIRAITEGWANKNILTDNWADT